MCHVSCVMCHVSCVMCHVSCVTCHLSHVTCHLSHVKIFFFLSKKIQQSGGASRWRVCYQQGLPRLVYLQCGIWQNMWFVTYQNIAEHGKTWLESFLEPVWTWVPKHGGTWPIMAGHVFWNIAEHRGTWQGMPYMAEHAVGNIKKQAGS